MCPNNALLTDNKAAIIGHAKVLVTCMFRTMFKQAFNPMLNCCYVFKLKNVSHLISPSGAAGLICLYRDSCFILQAI